MGHLYHGYVNIGIFTETGYTDSDQGAVSGRRAMVFRLQNGTC